MIDGSDSTYTFTVKLKPEDERRLWRYQLIIQSFMLLPYFIILLDAAEFEGIIEVKNGKENRRYYNNWLIWMPICVYPIQLIL